MLLWLLLLLKVIAKFERHIIFLLKCADVQLGGIHGSHHLVFDLFTFLLFAQRSEQVIAGTLLRSDL